MKTDKQNHRNAARAGRNWTDPQRLAIDHDAGDLLVSAAAGSGKTAVLAERCARLVCEGSQKGHRCGVENLLVVTFTEAAASEMRGRVTQAIHERVRTTQNATPETRHWLRRQAAMVDRASISTLHAFCSRVLRQHFHEAQIDPNFEVIDEEEALLLRDEVLDELLAKKHRLPSGEEARPFGDFFEVYAQGRDSTCREMIFKVHTMLASTADPARYLQLARGIYGAGSETTLRTYLEGTLARKLGLTALTAQRACAELTGSPSAGKNAAGAEGAARAIEAAMEALAHDGDIHAKWERARTNLNYSWPRWSSPKGLEAAAKADSEALKKRTWQKLKDKMEDIQADFAADPAAMLEDLHRLAEPLETLLGLARDFETAFTTAKRSQNRVDFHDLERLTLDLLTQHPSLAAEELRRRYHYLLVDEVQDINPLQWALLEAVRSPIHADGTQSGNLFLVGDVKQSIYGFRLAEPKLFLERERQWRKETSGSRKKYVALPHNFRSPAGLLEVMNGIFERLLTPEVVEIDYGEGHRLEPGEMGEQVTREPQVEIHLVAMDRETEQEAEESQADDPSADRLPEENLAPVEHEARMVSQRIAALLAEKRVIRKADGTLGTVALSDIAILLRNMKNKAMIFSRALARSGIAAHADLSTGYFDTLEIRETLALLQVLDNPRQDIPLATVLLGPYGGFAHDDLALVRLTYDRKEVPFADALARYASDPPFGPKSSTGVQELSAEPPPHSQALAEQLRDFFEKLNSWRMRLHLRPLHEGLAEIYSESKILACVSAQEAGQQRIANLQMFHQRALKFSTFRKQGLHRFLRFIDKLRDREGAGGGGGDLGEAPVLSEASDVVRIMSIHKSKGLEFPVVFVSGLGGKLNLRGRGNAGGILVDRHLGIGLEVADIERNISYPSAASARIAAEMDRSNRAEELRLLYVAITRARDHLILTGHIAKEEKLDRLRAQWENHSGALPEDVLLAAHTPLEWILPALACGGGDRALQVSWNETREDAQVSVTLHAPGEAQPTEETDLRVEDLEARNERLKKLLAREPLDNADSESAAAAHRVIQRITGAYPHAAMARQPAVQTVTFLKSIHDPEGEEFSPAAIPELEELAAATPGDEADQAGAASDALRAEQARQRGIATHRVLELLNLNDCDSKQAIEAQVLRLLERKALSAQEMEVLNWNGIYWMLLESSAGKRLVAAAKPQPGDNGEGISIRRELPFTWAAPLVPAAGENALPIDPADWPTIRGVIDALIVDVPSRRAELLDYKTDSAFTWEARLPDYTRQMHYYLRAASEILGFPVEKATLLFLGPRAEREVTL